MATDTDPQVLRESILAVLPEGAQVSVEGDSQHYSVCVVSPVFAGKSRVQQHQMIYAALGDRIGKAIHSVSIQTFTTEQWQARKDLIQA